MALSNLQKQKPFSHGQFSLAEEKHRTYSTLIAWQLCNNPYQICQQTSVADMEEDFVQDLTTYFFTSAAASINRRWVAKSKATVRVAYNKIHIVNIITILQIF